MIFKPRHLQSSQAISQQPFPLQDCTGDISPGDCVEGVVPAEAAGIWGSKDLLPLSDLTKPQVNIHPEPTNWHNEACLPGLSPVLSGSGVLGDSERSLLTLVQWCYLELRTTLSNGAPARTPYFPRLLNCLSLRLSPLAQAVRLGSPLHSGPGK